MSSINKKAAFSRRFSPRNFIHPSTKFYEDITSAVRFPDSIRLPVYHRLRRATGQVGGTTGQAPNKNKTLPTCPTYTEQKRGVVRGSGHADCESFTFIILDKKMLMVG